MSDEVVCCMRAKELCEIGLSNLPGGHFFLYRLIIEVTCIKESSVFISSNAPLRGREP